VHISENRLSQRTVILYPQAFSVFAQCFFGAKNLAFCTGNQTDFLPLTLYFQPGRAGTEGACGKPGEVMKKLLLVGALLLPSLLSAQRLLVANQFNHTLVIIDPGSRKTVATVGVDINGHEVIASPDGKLAYVPIYGDSGVGKPGTDGSTVEIVDIAAGRAIHIIDLGKLVRPHCAKFGPDGLLYVSAELAKAVDVIDPSSQRLVAEIPTGQNGSHMFAISPDGSRAYTANVFAGNVSVLDLHHHSLVVTISVAGQVQRISISPNGHSVYTHDQQRPRIAVIDTSTNAVSKWWNVPSVVYSSAPTPDGRWLVANAPAGKLFVLDTSSGAVAHSYDIPEALGETLVTPDGSRAYISCPQAGTVEILNLKTWELEKPIQLPKGGDGLAYAPSGVSK
jgi:DNA-binding beta-propeller fold protein YncE